MGTFERIRSISPYLFGIFALLLVAYFVFTSGPQDALQNQGSPDSVVIAEIDGKEILRKQYDSLINLAVNQEQARNKDNENFEIDYNALYQRVWNQLVDQTIFENLAEKAGVFVSDDELNDLILENTPEELKRGFIDSNGVFDKATYLKVWTNPESYKDYIPTDMPENQRREMYQNFYNQLLNTQKYYREVLKASGVQNLVISSEAMLSPEYAKLKYISEHSLATVDYIAVKGTDYKEEIKISDDELKKFYEEEKSKYEQEESRKVKYVVFRMIPSKIDTNNAQNRITRISEKLSAATTVEERDATFDELLDKYSGETVDYTLLKDVEPGVVNVLLGLENRQVVGPFPYQNKTMFVRLDGKRAGENEVIKASHILIKTNDNKDSAMVEAKKILKEAKKAGADFASLARRYSTGPSGPQGGDLGYFPQGAMVKPFNDAAFAANKGDVVGPVETQFGLHIIKVNDKTSDEVSYSMIEVAPKLTSTTRNTIRAAAKSFETQIREGKDFDELAQTLNLSVRNMPNLLKTKDFLGSNFLTAKIFEAKRGEVIDFKELDKFGVVVAMVDEIQKAGFQSFDILKAHLKRELTQKKKLDALEAKIKALHNKVASTGDLQAALQADPSLDVKTARNIKNSGMVPGIGIDYIFTETAFNMTVGKVSSPVRGESAWYIIQVKEREIPSEEQINQDLAGYIIELKQQAAKTNSAFTQWFANMKKEIDIKDYRSKYYSSY